MFTKDYHLGYRESLDVLFSRLADPAPGRIQLLSGPRQVGKTTLLLEIADRLGKQAIYAAADSPEAALPGFWERLWTRAEEAAADEGRAVVLLDEIHLLHGWDGRLKGAWDGLRRRRIPVHVVATGSSALRVAAGSRESLAGRFEKITLAHWSAASIAQAFGIEPGEAARLAVRMGTYPGAMEMRDDPRRWFAYVRDSIVEPAIGRDILALASIRRPALLRQVFGAAAASPAQIVSLQKIQGTLQDSGALETIAHYLGLLEEAFLVAPLRKFAASDVRRRAAPPKLVTLSNAFVAVMDPQGTAGEDPDPARFGARVENACLAHAWNTGQRVSYWREEPLEVDGVLEGSWGSWAIEVKSGRFQMKDLAGLLEFVRRHPGIRPLVVCDAAGLSAAGQAGVQAVTWQEFLLSGPPGSR